MFLLSGLVVLVLFYYCSNIIVSLFSSFVPSFSLYWQVNQKLLCVVQKQILSAPWKKSCKITRSSFWSEIFWKHDLYNWKTFSNSESFDLSYRSASEKLIATCCSIFPRFCPVLRLFSFAILALVFYLLKPFDQVKKQ